MFYTMNHRTTLSCTVPTPLSCIHSIVLCHLNFNQQIASRYDSYLLADIYPSKNEQNLVKFKVINVDLHFPGKYSEKKVYSACNAISKSLYQGMNTSSKDTREFTINIYKNQFVVRLITTRNDCAEIAVATMTKQKVNTQIRVFFQHNIWQAVNFMDGSFFYVRGLGGKRMVLHKSSTPCSNYKCNGGCHTNSSVCFCSRSNIKPIKHSNDIMFRIFSNTGKRYMAIEYVNSVHADYFWDLAVCIYKHGSTTERNVLLLYGLSFSQMLYNSVITYESNLHEDVIVAVLPGKDEECSRFRYNLRTAVNFSTQHNKDLVILPSIFNTYHEIQSVTYGYNLEANDCMSMVIENSLFSQILETMFSLSFSILKENANCDLVTEPPQKKRFEVIDFYKYLKAEATLTESRNMIIYGASYNLHLKLPSEIEYCDFLQTVKANVVVGEQSVALSKYVTYMPFSPESPIKDVKMDPMFYVYTK